MLFFPSFLPNLGAETRSGSIWWKGTDRGCHGICQERRGTWSNTTSACQGFQLNLQRMANWHPVTEPFGSLWQVQVFTVKFFFAFLNIFKVFEEMTESQVFVWRCECLRIHPSPRRLVTRVSLSRRWGWRAWLPVIGCGWVFQKSLNGTSFYHSWGIAFHADVW